MLNGLEVRIGENRELAEALAKAYKLISDVGYELVFIATLKREGPVMDGVKKEEMACSWGPGIRQHTEGHSGCHLVEQLQEAVKLAVDQPIRITEQEKRDSKAQERFCMPASSQTVN